MAINILYEDNHLIVVHKPFNILTQGDRTRKPSLYDLVKNYIKTTYNKPGNVFLGLVHRLDKPVSGIIVFAKTSKSASRLSKQFAEHTTAKKYYALVEGKMRVGEKKKLIHYLKKNRKKNLVKAISTANPNYKEAKLAYQVIPINKDILKLFETQKNTNDCSLLEIDLITGRSHQIRAQLSAIGHPIIGDKKYGSNTITPKNNLTLIAYQISFVHPTTQKILTFSLL